MGYIWLIYNCVINLGRKIKYALNLCNAFRLSPTLRTKGPVQLICKNISFGKYVDLRGGVRIMGSGYVHIGDNVAIGNDTIIFCVESIIIGKNSMLAAQCYLIDADHGILGNSPIGEQSLESLPIVIGEDVWLGAGVKVLKGVHIADGCVIGAGAVLTRSTEPFGIYGGVPARKIGTRRTE